MINDQDSPSDMIKIALLNILEEKWQILTKEEKDSIIMLYIETDLLQ